MSIPTPFICGVPPPLPSGVACLAKKGILKAEQGGFKKRHGTVDSKQQNAAPTNGDQTDLEVTGVIEEEAGPLDYAISEEEIK